MDTDTPTFSAISASGIASRRIQSRNATIDLASLGEAPSAPTVLPTARLSEVLAIVAVALIDAVDVADRRAARERLANRLHGFGLTPDGSIAAQMLSRVSADLMRLEWGGGH